jgi:hypothetical protein
MPKSKSPKYKIFIGFLYQVNYVKPLIFIDSLRRQDYEKRNLCKFYGTAYIAQ